MPHYNLYPLLELLHREDPLEITRYLDEMLNILVQFSENEGHLNGLGHRYYLLRELRNAFLKTAKDQCHGNL